MLDRLKKHNRLIALLASVIGIILFFVGGIFSSNTENEKIADYVTNVVVNQTNNKSLCALTIGQTNESGQILDPYNEFHNTYGTFMQQRIAFASTVNADKERLIKFEDIECGNLSFLYGGAVGTIPYDEHYLHNTLPVELMFVDERMYQISNNPIYISQSQADKLLDHLGFIRQEDGLHTNAEYQSLLKQPATISIDGVVVTDFVIQNIYFEGTYYCDSLSEVMGDFVMFSYYLPEQFSSVERRNMYFFDEYVYHNRYFMNYINNAYPSRNYSLKLNHFNISGEVDEDYFLSFYYTKLSKSIDWLNSLCVVTGIVLLTGSVLLHFFVHSNKEKTIAYCVLQLSVLFVPYLVFALIYKITGNISFFSETACKTNLFGILIYGFIFSLFLIYEKWFSKKKGIDIKDTYEINI